MSFLPSQTRKLKTKLPPRSVRQRDINGQAFNYVEGWYVISEANRIFGFDGWDRETLEAKCLWAKQSGDRFSVAYLTKVRISVNAGERRVVREGTGFGEATFANAAQSHEFAIKAAETDATKRAIVTFGNAFGLSLYAPATSPRPERGQDSYIAGSDNGPETSRSLHRSTNGPEPDTSVQQFPKLVAVTPRAESPQR
ncbi:MAG: Rad52/Rad22 family DNA repair protein [Hyphomicrobiaceae bacterium]